MGRSGKRKEISRSRSRERKRHRDKKHERRRSSSEYSSSENSSDDGRRRHQHRRRSRDGSRSESRSRSRSPRPKKRHKHRKRARSRSRSGSPAPHRKDSRRTEQQFEPRQAPLTKEEKRQKKELLKLTETVEQKRARRLAKKLAKDRKRKEEMGWDEEMMGYTNADNPFGDPNLLDTFVWHKKNETAGLGGLAHEHLKGMMKGKQVENRLELQKVKQRRIEREKEREQREKELEELQRMREAESFKEWEKQEDSFHLNQAKLRSKIRIQDGRAKPIDLLAQYVSADLDDDLSVEMQEPYNVLRGLTIIDLEDLLEDIIVYKELEKDSNLEFWKDMTVIAEDELAKLKKISPEGQDGADRREGINASVSTEVAGVFRGKKHSQLLALKEQIMRRIKSGNAGVDIGYWESLLQQLNAHMARARLKEQHQERLKRKLNSLRQQQGVVSDPRGASPQATAGFDPSEIPLPSDSDGEDHEIRRRIKKEPESSEEAGPTQAEGGAPSKSAEEPESVLTQADLEEECITEFEKGGYSPKLVDPKALPPETLIFDPDEDRAKLLRIRQQLITTGSAENTVELEFIKKARAGMDSDEATFAVEVDVQSKPYLWSDKYRPRKPRFFNRVHTGFEWNKYNQTHYDMDNPPPKVVQGYKFNIFYPDLIDKRKTPEYTLTPCPENEDFAVLQFHTGPPYEDIAFKIVNREWEYSHRHGFRCQFNNSIFQLWFRFKRYRYRR
ncbi:cactin-like [Acanthaster planci]|uniref:Splicing factor Cactin n=1 Tax=Acanthaster planci TaxID=133434 RepID=A0A8B8A0R8_ACAPL|nr:cactin-like [Acanthaster planci]